MKKRFESGIILAVLGLCGALVSCPNPAGSNSPPPPPPASSTLIQFVNEGAYKASVYHDPQRSSLAASIGPGGRSELLGAIPLDTATFYPSFILIIDDAEILFTPSRAIEARIDADKTTSIPIPYLDQLYPDHTAPLVAEAYLSIKNEGGNGFRLQSGVNSLTPLGRSEVEVNDGETAVYRVAEGSAQMYEILSSAQPYPLGITQFEAGHLYTLTFKGAAVTAAADQVISMDNLSPQGDLPALTGLRAQTAGNGAALTWNAAAEWPRCRVYRSQSAAGVYSPITDYNLESPAYTDNHASRETLNYYKVRGYSADGRKMSVFSEPCALALAAPPAPAAPELTPDNGQLRAVWETHPLAERYEVYIGTAASFSGAVKKAEVRDGANSAVIGGLENGTRYYVWIKAVNSAGASQVSPPASGTPDAFTQPPPAPAAPILTAGNREIAVSWQALATAASYTLWYGTDNNSASATRYAAGLTGTSAVISGLVNGQTYYVWVQGWNRKGDGPKSPAASAAPSVLAGPPRVPAAPVVTAGSRELLVSWQATEGAESYEVWAGTSSNPASAVKQGEDTTALSATVTNLVNETAYYVWIQAKNRTGTSGFSPAASGTPTALAAPPAAPAAPTVTPGDGQLFVNWQAVEGAESYDVWAGTSGNSADAAKLGADISGLSTALTGLTNGTAYYVWIKAKNSAGTSGFSPEASGTPIATAAAPAVNAGNAQLTVSWTALAGAEEYEVFCGTGTNPPAEAAQTVSAASVTLTGLVNGTTYNVWVRGKNTTGTGALSAAASAKPIGNMGEVALSLSDSSLTVQWAAVAGADQYEVYYSTSDTMPESPAQTVTETSATIGGLTNGATYYVWVKPKNANGAGAVSARVSGTPRMIGLYKGAAFATAEYIGNHNLDASLSYIADNALSGDNYYIVLGANETIAPQVLSYPGKTVGITLMADNVEQTVQLGLSGPLFAVYNYVTLTLQNNVTLKGMTNNTRSLVTIDGNGIFIMNGGEISGNSIPSTSNGIPWGGGVCVNGGTFIMNGGKISGNSVTTYSSTTVYGGGVFVNGGMFTMNGGEISGNSAYGQYVNGGGVAVRSPGTFTMNGGKISGNSASSASSSARTYSGGGVYAGGTFTMSGGEISGNTVSSSSSNYGGGVYVYSSGTFTKAGTGGVIYGNNAASTLKNNASGNGDAVYRYSGSKKRNSTIPANEAFDSSSDVGWE